MRLLIDKRYEIVFLSQYPMGLQLGEKTVEKSVKCTTSTTHYWLNRWKESNDLSDIKRSERLHATTEKANQRILELADSDNNYSYNR